MCFADLCNIWNLFVACYKHAKGVLTTVTQQRRMASLSADSADRQRCSHRILVEPTVKFILPYRSQSLGSEPSNTDLKYVKNENLSQKIAQSFIASVPYGPSSIQSSFINKKIPLFLSPSAEWTGRDHSLLCSAGNTESTFRAMNTQKSFQDCM